jgi:glycogen debranching enzyme
LAKNEIRGLLKLQRADGFIPHVIFWEGRGIKIQRIWELIESRPWESDKTTQQIQPPIIAKAVEAIYEKDKDIFFLKEVVPKLAKYYKWLATHRDPDQDGFISIISSYESGLDQNPSYDAICNIRSNSVSAIALGCRKVSLKNMMRGYNLEKIFEEDYFNVEDTLVNAIYVDNLKILSKLLNEIDDEEGARSFHHHYLKVRDSFVDKFYNKEDKFFYDRYTKKEVMGRVKTVKGLIPLLIDLPKKVAQDLVETHLKNPNEFYLPYPIPSVGANEPTFSAGTESFIRKPLLWRGPSWVNTNWFVMIGLKRHGFKEEAEHIKQKSIELVQKNGFREFFNPFTGEGSGARHFSWSTLTLDMLFG